MLWLYQRVLTQTARRALSSWPAALSLIVYALILIAATFVLGQLGIIGGFLLGFVLAACWSSYLELISQAVTGIRFRLTWDDFRQTFMVRFWDVVSVLFAFWIISLVTRPLLGGDHGVALSAMLGFAMAFFFNVVPELLYQGSSRSFQLLLDSARFVMEHPLSWFLPNLLFAALALLAGGGLSIQHPAKLLILFGDTFSSPIGVLSLFAQWPAWAWPIALLALHFVMVFRGLLFKELSSGGGNTRMQAFRRRMGG
jgi:hypothetical protein